MRRFAAAMLMAAGSISVAHGQIAAGTNDATFNTADVFVGAGFGFNNEVFSIVLQPDGKIVVGGNFTTYNYTARTRITRLNADGSLDESFDPGTGFSSTVYSIALQPDGKLVVGGYFESYNGTARNRIARLNADGSLDTSFNPGTGFNGGVYSIGLQPDGKIVVGGFFTTFNGTARNRIARLNADGSLDASFNPGSGFIGGVQSIALQPDGRMVVGGFFTSFNGTARNMIVRLNADGSLDASFNTGTGFNESIQSIILQPDGKIVVGGWFTFYNGIARTRITRLNADGSLDASFDPGTGFDSTVYSIALQPDGKLVVGGYFESYNGTARNMIVRLNADGSLDASFNTGTGFSLFVYYIVLQPDGKLMVGGDFSSYNNIPRRRIARLYGGEGNTLNTAREQQTGLDVQVYPNPSRGDVSLILSGAAAPGAIQLTLYNAMGRHVLTREVHAAETQSGLKLSVPGLASGIYFLRISTCDTHITRKLVLEK